MGFSSSKGSVKVLEIAREVSKNSEILANEVRVLILALLLKNKSMTWSDLKKSLKTLLGTPDLNPNLLAFHLRKLVKSGFVLRKELDENITYEVQEDKIPNEIRELLKPILETL